MQQQISLITLGIGDPARARRFYVAGFGWTPVFEAEGIAFFQMNGLVFGLWDRSALDEDMGRQTIAGSSGLALAHNVAAAAEVDRLVVRLAEHGGTVLREPGNPSHGGRRGYVADPDGHAWEIAWNPAWRIDAQGQVTFGV